MRTTPPHNSICQIQDGIGEKKEEKEDQRILAKKPKDGDARSRLAWKGLTSTSNLDVINLRSVKVSFYSKI
jgi:hypothetical protein